MSFNAFSAGTMPGGLHTTYEINILLCYLLKSVNSALTKTQLSEILQANELVNYFELTNSLNDLVKSGHIALSADENGGEAYTVTELGIKSADELNKIVSLSVREKAVNAALNLIARVKRERSTVVDIITEQDGFTVSLAIPDKGTDLMLLKLFVPDMLQAQQVKEKFLNDPQGFYTNILTMLLQNKSEDENAD